MNARRRTGDALHSTITVYLLSDAVSSSASAISPDSRAKKLKVTIGGKKCDLFVQAATAHPPRWIRFFGGEVNPQEHHLMASSPAGVLIVPHKKRLFALTFGHGRHILATSSWEERFGLKVTLNAVEPNSIRSLTKQSFDALARLVQEQSSRSGRAADFGLDVERDLLKAVTGTPIDVGFASRLSGADALVANVAVTAAGLPAFLDQCLKYHNSDGYKKEYPWVDQIAAVKSKDVVADLDGQLVSLLKKNQMDRLWLAVPEMLDWTVVDGFTFSLARAARREPDLHVRDFLSSVDNPKELTLDVLKKRHAVCWANDSEDRIIDRWSVYKCIYCELDAGGSTYLLNSGKWYRVDKNFVSAVNAAVDGIPAPSGLAFPPCGDVDEGVYNKQIQRSDRSFYALMDCKNVPHGGGHSQIELCDLLTKDRRLIHIKKYGGSAVLSHLFAQAAVSGELLFTDPDFRTKANALLPVSHKFPSPMAPSDYEVVLGIISWTKKKLDLPFFSRVNLRAAHRRLKGFGYNVSLATIRGPSSPKPGQTATATPGGKGVVG